MWKPCLERFVLISATTPWVYKGITVSYSHDTSTRCPTLNIVVLLIESEVHLEKRKVKGLGFEAVLDVEEGDQPSKE
jgi:hypothetical protein